MVMWQSKSWIWIITTNTKYVIVLTLLRSNIISTTYTNWPNKVLSDYDYGVLANNRVDITEAMNSYLKVYL